MDINGRLFTDILTRTTAAVEDIAKSLNGIQDSLEQMANTERQQFELDVDSRAITNALNNDVGNLFATVLPQLLRTLGVDPVSED